VRVAAVVALTLLALLGLLEGGVPGSGWLFAAAHGFLGLAFVLLFLATAYTALRQVRREHARDTAQLEQTQQSLQLAHDELQRIARFRQQVFANITHELKTPLALILTPMEMLLDGEMGEVPPQVRRSLQTMFRNGLRLLKMIGDILDLTQLAESSIKLKVAEYDLVPYLRNLVDQVQPLTRRKQLGLSFSAGDESCPTWCDLEQLERVFVNLLSNAVKFTPPGGHIQVRLRVDGPVAVVRVEDDGPGLRRDEAEHVFERFFQADVGPARRQGGVGIGLALARELALLHGGDLAVDTTVERGAAFELRLPRDHDHFDPGILSRDSIDPEATQDKLAADFTREDLSGRFTVRDDYRMLDITDASERRLVERDEDEDHHVHTVLVVEDNPDIVRMVHAALRHEFRIMTAADGEAGLAMTRQHLPDLVLTDLMMPRMDGLELTRGLRAGEATRHIPVVMLTARSAIEDRMEGLRTGVNAYLAKPFAPRELRTTIDNQLRSAAATADLLLSRRMDSLEIVAGGLAHEINNPLSYIKNAVAIIRTSTEEILALGQAAAERELTDEETARLTTLRARQERMMSSAETGIRRIADTVDLMRRYSREGFTRTPQLYDAFRAVEEVIAVIAPAHGAAVRVDTGFRGNGTISCVPEELNQVLTNLVENAIQAAGDGGGTVQVRGRRDDDDVIFEIQDDGPGMAPDVQDRIFTPFFTTKDPGGGMGLGLTITRRVIKSHGGTIEVTSREGHGTTFKITLPAS